ncbi:uncharacterized protein KY384_008228 [Bacidia gigantensis]|uniref:uncharacterized protein n=1 Tax=Bacidia gigantensis TaxID=2732470 RepID=UPI001D052CCC|nr:uncharacterized protein KY384_008228 [Bacidia gigantensis]KAG8526799.1 hypothetical protein KY384_008228 [Bacidia gigantensis]
MKGTVGLAGTPPVPVPPDPVPLPVAEGAVPAIPPEPPEIGYGATEGSLPLEIREGLLMRLNSMTVADGTVVVLPGVTVTVAEGTVVTPGVTVTVVEGTVVTLGVPLVQPGTGNEPLGAP